MAQLNQDLTGYSENQQFDLIPAGWYQARVVDSEVKQSQKGNLMAAFTFEIMGPTHPGRKVFDNFVLGNEVAMQRLKALAVACRLPNPNYVRDTEELHGKALLIKVGVRPAKDDYDERNNIKVFKALDQQGGTPPSPGAPGAAACPAPSFPNPNPAPGTAPWSQPAPAAPTTAPGPSAGFPPPAAAPVPPPAPAARLPWQQPAA